MNVRDLQISLRPRNGWEAVDLGFLLTRRHYHDLVKIGVVVLLPLWALLFILFWNIPALAFLCIWWLKPIYDRLYLHYLSRRIFGDEITVKEVFKKAPAFLFKSSLPLLTIRRFSPWRSMTLPVHDLEGLKGGDYAQRCGVVKRVGGGASAQTTFTLHACESVWCISIFILFFMFIPQINWGAVEEGYSTILSDKGQQLILTRVSAIVYALTYLFLEPFYVGAGFTLYLNSRCSQEAWDVELRFKELAQRVKDSFLQVASVLLCSLTVLLGTTTNGHAEGESMQPLSTNGSDVNTTTTLSSERNAQEVIKEVYAHEDFKIHYRIEERWDFSEEEEDWMVDLMMWLFSLEDGESGGKENTAIALEGVLRLVAVVVLSLLVITLAIVLIRMIKLRRLIDEPNEKRLKKRAPEKVLGMEISKESLPADVLASAREAWTAGEYKKAYSFLYRQALSKGILDYDAEIVESDTEYECLRACKKVLSTPHAEYFTTLTRQWIQVAYSKERVSEREFNNLCQSWVFND